MRSEKEMFDLILETAREDERIRAVMMNGSRANPAAHRDFFQDFDIVYFVSEIASFKADADWIQRFGERIILQLPDDMSDPPPDDGPQYTYLMQFADGNRIDLCLFPVAKLAELESDSQSVLLLDKDGLFPSLAPPSDQDYLPQPPSAKAYADCCNEFWWVSAYVAKGLWRQEIIYARHMLDEFVRSQLMRMLVWHIGVNTGFTRNPGKFGKYFQQYLEPELWEQLLQTYPDANYEHTWEALFVMGDLFQVVAQQVARHFRFEYPLDDDRRVSAHLRHIKNLPREASKMY